MTEQLPAPRSAGSLAQRRIQQPWPADREFKILSIDGGGIKGIFPACVLAELEGRYNFRGSIANHFDLITGTSTGGIIALSLSIGLPAKDIAQIYIDRGGEIFPPYSGNPVSYIRRWWNGARSLFKYRYDRSALSSLLEKTFGDRLLGNTTARLCIPACDGTYGDVYIFKTPHHPDFKKDLHEKITTVALATAAAPTFFKPVQNDGYRLIDGGLWANNPIMVGLVDALTCFDVDRHKVRILSLGCGDEPFYVTDKMISRGGKLSWIDAISGAMAFQSQAALGQAKLLVGAERVERLVPPQRNDPIALDDWIKARDLLPNAAKEIVDVHGASIFKTFLS